MKTLEDYEKIIPGLREQLEKAEDFYRKIQSVDFVLDYIMIGSAFTKNTYKTYKLPIKNYYIFLNKIKVHPLDVNESDLEKFYDTFNDYGYSTLFIIMSALKRLYKNIEKKMPIFGNPFRDMNIPLQLKLNLRIIGRPKGSLAEKELNDLLEYLKKDKTLKGQQNYIMILFLVRTGLKAFQLCKLKFKDIEYINNWYRVRFIKNMKGGREGTVKIQEDVVDGIKDLYERQFKKAISYNDNLFNALESYKGKPETPMSRSVLWRRINDIGMRVKELRIVDQYLQFSPQLFVRTYEHNKFKAMEEIQQGIVI